MFLSTKKGRSPAQWEWWELRPYERSRCTEHGESCHRALRGVPAPPGVVMVAPSSTLRNAAARKAKGRATKGLEVERGQGQYKGRSPKAPPLWVPKPDWGGGGKSPSQTMD